MKLTDTTLSYSAGVHRRTVERDGDYDIVCNYWNGELVDRAWVYREAYVIENAFAQQTADHLHAEYQEGFCQTWADTWRDMMKEYFGLEYHEEETTGVFPSPTFNLPKDCGHIDITDRPIGVYLGNNEFATQGIVQVKAIGKIKPGDLCIPMAFCDLCYPFPHTKKQHKKTKRILTALYEATNSKGDWDAHTVKDYKDPKLSRLP